MYEVSCFPVKQSKHSSSGWTADLLQRFSLEIKDPIAAKDLALGQRQKGYCVILRPKFNEAHLGDLGFREWRSFDGELFSEIHWPAKGPTSSQARLDNEIILPIPVAS